MTLSLLCNTIFNRDASEESFPLLDTLVIKWCDKLEEIPLSFADINRLSLLGARTNLWRLQL